MLSTSTAAFDQDEKFKDYQQTDLLQEYGLIAQQTQRLECRRCSTSGDWEVEVDQAGDRVRLTSLGLEFDLAELYRGLDEDEWEYVSFNVGKLTSQVVENADMGLTP